VQRANTQKVIESRKGQGGVCSLHFYDIPRIKLVIDGVEESHYPSEPLESYYIKNKRDNNGFIAKASFKYENNRITLASNDFFNNRIIASHAVSPLSSLVNFYHPNFHFC